MIFGVGNEYHGVGIHFREV